MLGDNGYYSDNISIIPTGDYNNSISRYRLGLFKESQKHGSTSMSYRLKYVILPNIMEELSVWTGRVGRILESGQYKTKTDTRDINVLKAVSFKLAYMTFDANSVSHRSEYLRHIYISQPRPIIEPRIQDCCELFVGRCFMTRLSEVISVHWKLHCR